MSTVAEALQWAGALGLERLDAQILLLHALGRAPTDRGWLVAHDEDPVAPEARAAFESLCRRRSEGEPVAYLLGEKEFYGLPLKVDRRVLVPRPDTETLVEWSLAVLRERRGARILDLGTGSGAIALALRQRRRDTTVEAVDISAEALLVARENAQRLGLPVRFRQGDWFAGAQGPYDLIVGNPPYIAADDPHLPALRHEPAGALVAGPDGLDAIRRIVAQAPAFLAPGGWLLLEHGHDQAERVRALLAQAGLADVQGRRDLAGIERCSGARRAELG